jgi:hypothetical protein
MPAAALAVLAPDAAFSVLTPAAGHLCASRLKASRPLIRVLVINDNHYGLTCLFEL